MNLKLNLKYAIATFILLCIEICIAIFYFNLFIRGFVGDVLVVILLYCLVKAIIDFETKKLAFAILIFAFFVEMLQYFHFADVMNIQNKIIRILIGTAFEFTDLLAYLIGYLIVLAAEFYHKRFQLCN